MTPTLDLGEIYPGSNILTSPEDPRFCCHSFSIVTWCIQSTVGVFSQLLMT